MSMKKESVALIVVLLLIVALSISTLFISHLKISKAQINSNLCQSQLDNIKSGKLQYLNTTNGMYLIVKAPDFYDLHKGCYNLHFELNKLNNSECN